MVRLRNGLTICLEEKNNNCLIPVVDWINNTITCHECLNQGIDFINTDSGATTVNFHWPVTTISHCLVYDIRGKMLNSSLKCLKCEDTYFVFEGQCSLR